MSGGVRMRFGQGVRSVAHQYEDLGVRRYVGRDRVGRSVRTGTDLGMQGWANSEDNEDDEDNGDEGQRLVQRKERPR